MSIPIIANVDIGDVGFQTHHPVLGELPVVTGLAAADEAVAIETNLSRACAARDIGHVCPDLSGRGDVVVFTKRIARVNAEIETGPVVSRRDGAQAVPWLREREDRRHKRRKRQTQRRQRCRSK